jgi:hypothetical protein
VSKDKQHQIDELHEVIEFCKKMANMPIMVPDNEPSFTPINELALAMYSTTYKEGHPARAHGYTIQERWMWCAREFDKKVRIAERELLAQAKQLDTELASLRLLCKRILATYDSSGYAKGTEQELWREFKREVEK